MIVLPVNSSRRKGRWTGGHHHWLRLVTDCSVSGRFGKPRFFPLNKVGIRWKLCCVQHYHRYFYLDDGWKEDNIFIPGVLHTVRPIALREIPVFTENCREYTLMHTAHFGKVVQVEVGAMLVGKIRNYHRRYSFSRGEEKGCFLYGGSTIIVLLQKNRVNIFPDIRKASLEGREVPVRLGQAVGENWKLDVRNRSESYDNGSNRSHA